MQKCYDPTSNSWAAPHIPRGDLQTTFVFKGFDDVRRLGLSHGTEAAVRASFKSEKDGMCRFFKTWKGCVGKKFAWEEHNQRIVIFNNLLCPALSHCSLL
jgi:hypothetical protein